ncbi:ATP/GTP-binding protein [Brachyspira pilosicoli]|uniref:AAA family ATPase n=1 Tax=Brachyspira pilosicoli TaxID=52584 RepID=UPI001CA5A730|nr:AAA family ATPase [Brachyspira pilosicoli]MBW5397137.1 ATPase [Brachyspira pilosicoli]
MLESLEIENFRGIKKLKIDNFKNINFFIGKANTSKTSLLEAIYISLEQSPVSLYILFALRSIFNDDDAFESLFHDYNYNNVISLNYIFDKKNINIKIQKDNINSFAILRNNNGNNLINKLLFIKKDNDEKIFSVEYNYKDNNITIIPEDKIYNDIIFITVENFENNLTLYNNLKKILSNNDYIEKFREIYKQFDNKINDIRFLGNTIVVSLENLNHTINIKYMGKGFQTYISIIASMVAGNKYIVIDEIENGMHFESIKTLLENILTLSKEYELQFFITTHNKELLEILNECLIEKNYKDMLSVYNVYYNKENNIDVINYSQENFSNLIENNNEMRD